MMRTVFSIRFYMTIVTVDDPTVHNNSHKTVLAAAIRYQKSYEGGTACKYC